MIREIANTAGLVIKEGNVVDLGWENGWYYSEKIISAYNQFMQYKTSVSSKTIGNCVTETTWILNDGVEEFTLISKVDSGD